MRRVISPRGWAQYEPPPARSGWLELRLMPSPVLPADRMADAGGLCECRGKVGVVSVMLGSGEGPRGWLLLELGPRRYWVRLAPAGAASAPLNSPAHALYIMCPPGQPCDLSPLMALADPLHYPQYAAAAARAYLAGPEPHGRWIPGCEHVDCSGVGLDGSSAKGALDILADPERLHALFTLAYDMSAASRERGHSLGLWTLRPGGVPEPGTRGQFTTVASLALMYIAHMVPFTRLERYLRLPAAPRQGP
jgi:hypothetical protein